MLSKHVPQRTCISCRGKRPQRELVRLVRDTSGTVKVDLKGKEAGRGVYLCPSLECWQKGLGKKRLDHALRTNLTAENREELLKFQIIQNGVSGG